jgi:hypothetical protein
MPRRRSNPIEEFVAVAGGLFVLGMVVSPQFRAVVLLSAFAAFLLFLGWIPTMPWRCGRRREHV